MRIVGTVGIVGIVGIVEMEIIDEAEEMTTRMTIGEVVVEKIEA
jgi:hypothetical protein